MGFFENVFGAPQETPPVENVAPAGTDANPTNTTNQFNTLGSDRVRGIQAGGYQDPAVGYANARKTQAQLGFRHIPSGKETYFMAFLTDFSDQFSSDWNEEKVYGRMDPIMTFRGTSRKLSLGWAVPADARDVAENNLRKIEGLIKSLYPTYEQNDGANSISKSPLIRMKFANLIARGMGDSLNENGLLGVMSGLSFSPDIDAGFFDGTPGKLAPKVINLSCDFTVLHERELGWDAEGKWRDQSTAYYFPYQTAAPAGGDFGSNVMVATTLAGEIPEEIEEGQDNPDDEADNNVVTGG